MPSVGFEPTISAGERPQTYALDRAVTGTGNYEPAHPANTWVLNGHPLLRVLLTDDFSGHLVFSASQCALTVVKFWCQSVPGLLSSPNIRMQ